MIVGLAITGIGALLVGLALTFPARNSRVSKAETRLDEFMPVWQFRERHARRIAAPPERVFAAIRNVRANEITLFKTLTWIRRGGRKTSESILNAGDSAPLLDIATRSGFMYLADDPPRELVVGTVVIGGSRVTGGSFTQAARSFGGCGCVL